MTDGSGIGSGSGDNQQNLAPFMCDTDSVDALQLEIFDVLATKLAQLLGCSPTDANERLLYIIIRQSGDPIEIAEATNTVEEYFDLGTYNDTTITVCLQGTVNGSLTCDALQTEVEVYNTSIVVGPNTKRLFPYGSGDVRFTNIDDSTIGVVSSNGIPFFSGTYNRLHVSSYNNLSVYSLHVYIYIM